MTMIMEVHLGGAKDTLISNPVGKSNMDLHPFRRHGIINNNVIKIYKIAPKHFQQLCIIVCPNYQGKIEIKKERSMVPNYPKC